MPLTDTLSEMLDTYDIGPKIRALRVQKKMGLVKLASHTGLSAALLSKIERGKMYPTLPTLLKISMVFSLGLDYFLKDRAGEVSIVRKDERVRLPQTMGIGNVAYFFESLDFPATERKFSAYYADFESLPIEDVRLHKHEGDEFIFVLEGKLGLYIRGKETALDKSDSVYFKAALKHGYRGIGRKRCRALVVTIP